MNFDLNTLRTLVAAVDLNGFGKAAERLHRTPGAVSLQIKALEERLDKKLFRKVGRQQALTEAGELLVGYARRLLALNDEAALALQAVGLEGEVRFGMPQDFADGWLPSTLAQFARAHRGVRVHIHVDRSGHIVERVDKGDLDLGLAFTAAAGAPASPIGQMPMQWYAAADFELGPDDPVPLLVLDPPCLFRQSAIEALDKAGRPWRVAVTSASVSALWAAAQAGLGVVPRLGIHAPVGLAPRSMRLPPLRSVALHLVRDRTNARVAAANLAAVVEQVVQARLGQ